MWDGLKRAWYRKRLLRSEYDSLFESSPPDEWVSVDCETTGLDRSNDEIISIGAVLIRESRIMTSERLELFIRPSGQVKAESIRIHHLRSMDVAHGLAPLQAIQKFLDFVGSRPLVGYYLEFDVAMLDRLARPFLGIPLPQRKIEVSGLYYDYKSSQHANSNVDLSFHNIMQDLQLPERTEHDALNDALMAAMMFVKLRHLLKKTGR
ncbi:MAG: 3'-5' exonuclease [Burkholderiales bacterium]|nr:3'-5' exonuclease [Ferrovum sp.]